MHRGIRRMFQLDDERWVIYCKVCPRPNTPPNKAIDATARECHDWWRIHVTRPEHLEMVAYAEARSERNRKQKTEDEKALDARLREIFPRR